jgi:hypothetical protein
VSARTGFGDETWRLAREGDAPGLERAAAMLLEGAVLYEGHRARAFALAVQGRADDALAELNAGWTDEWPFPSVYALDVARVRYLAGELDEALAALTLAVRGSERVDPAVAELAAACVRRSRRCWARALRLALAGGTAAQRAAASAAVLRARFGG